MADQPEGQERHGAPMFYTSSIRLVASGTDIKIAFEDSVPVHDQKGELQAENFRVALVQMSFHTAKDLSALLNQTLAGIEAQLGEIDTPFLQKQRAEPRE